MSFLSIFREERHYCNHLFRLLCYRKEDGGANSGLGRFLALAGLPVGLDVQAMATAELYAEVAVFRDYYHAHPDRPAFLLNLYDALLPLLCARHAEEFLQPTPLPEAWPRLQGVHPRLFSRHMRASEQDKLFYGEFARLFSAKPDLLIICPELMVWIEVKVGQPFDREQLQRTQTIADLCSADLFAPLFGRRPNRVLKLGSKRHRQARRDGDFIDWEDVARIAAELLPHGEGNYTAQALRRLA